MPTRAVLFDFDGVIADTENVHVAAWQRTFGLMGWLESDEACARAAEVDDRAFVAEVFARRKIDGGDVEGWVARKQELTAPAPGRLPQGLSRASPRWSSGSGAGPGSAVVTTTWRANVEAVLEASGLAEAFEFVVAKEDVEATKPDPEGYRLALTKLKLPASRGRRPGGLAHRPGRRARRRGPGRGRRPPEAGGGLGRRRGVRGRLRRPRPGPGRPGLRPVAVRGNPTWISLDRSRSAQVNSPRPPARIAGGAVNRPYSDPRVRRGSRA